MALRIIDTGSHADTWADFARSKNVEREYLETPIFAKSHAYSLLVRELKRYLQGQIRGRSFLISGHRGSGKTSLVLRAVQDLQHRDTGALVQRPLLVKLHGPSLLAPINNENDKADKKDNEEDGAALAVLVEITIALYRALCGEVTRCYRDHAIEKSLLGNENDLQELAGQLSLELDNAPDPVLLREFWDRVGALRSGVLWSHLSQKENHLKGWRWLRWPSLSDIYHRRSHEQENDQGIRELVAISTAAQAFQVVSGSIEYKTEKIDNVKTDTERSSSVKPPVKEIVNSLMGLIAGVLVGGAAFVKEDQGVITSAVIGLLMALATGLTLTWSTTRKRERSTSRHHTFIRKRDVTTLDRELPIVIERIRAAGLAPVFVVDELDKVDNLRDLMAHLVQRLKHLVADYSFFCFLTDRDYFEYLHDLSQQSAYPKEHTYFSHRLFVLYHPNNLHMYLDELIKVESGSDREKEGKFALSYLLLHRAMLHTFDLQRELAKVCDDQGRVLISTGELWTELGYRYHIMIQLAIETLLSEPELRDRLNQDPQFGQVAYDVLYMPTRHWLSGEPELNLSDESIERYLRDRLQPGEPTSSSSKDEPQSGNEEENNSVSQDDPQNVKEEADKPARSPLAGLVRETDRHYLVNLVRRLAAMLAEPAIIIELLTEGSEDDMRMASLIQLIPANETDKRIESEESSENNGIAEEDVQKTEDKVLERNPLIRKMNKEGTLYHWCRDPYGRNVFEEQQLAELIDVKGQIVNQEFIDSVVLCLQELCGTQFSLGNLAELGVLKRTPDWEQVHIAGERLLMYREDKQKYEDLIPHQEALHEYADMLVRRGKLLGKTLIAGMRVGLEAEKAGDAAQIISGVEALSTLLALPTILNFEETENRIENFSKNNKLDITLPVLTRNTVKEWSTALRENLDEVKQQTPQALNQHRDTAWNNIIGHIKPYLLKGVMVYEPGLDEAACVAAGVMPSAALMKPFNEILISEASQVIKWSLENNKVDSVTYVPLWVGIPLLYLLGLNRIVNEWAEMLAILSKEKYFSTRELAQNELNQMHEKNFSESVFAHYEDKPPRPAVLIISMNESSMTSHWRISDEYGAFAISFDDLWGDKFRFLFNDLFNDLLGAILNNEGLSMIFIDLGEGIIQKNAPMLPDLPDPLNKLPTFYLASTPVYEKMVDGGRVIHNTETLDDAMREALATMTESA